MEKNYAARTFKILGLIMLLGLVGLAFVPTLFVGPGAYETSFPATTVYGAVKDLVSHLFKDGAWTHAFESWALYPLLAAVLLTLVLFIASLFMKKRERVRNLYVALAVADALLLFTSAVAGQWYGMYEFEKAVYSAFALYGFFAAVMLVVFTSVGCASKRRQTFKALAFLFSAIAAVGMGLAVLRFDIGVQLTGLRAYYFGKDSFLTLALTGLSKTTVTILYIAYDALLALVAINLVCSVFGLAGKRCRAFDAVRFLLMFAVAVFLVAFSAIRINGFETMKVYGLFAAGGAGLAAFVCALLYGKAKAAAPAAATVYPADSTAADSEEAEKQMIMEEVIPEPVQPAPEPVQAEETTEAEQPAPAEGQISMEEISPEPEAEQPAEEAPAPEPERIAPEQPAAEQPAAGAQTRPAADGVPPVYGYEQPAYRQAPAPDYRYEQPRPAYSYEQPRPAYEQQPVYGQPAQPAYEPAAQPIVRIVPAQPAAPAPGTNIDSFYETLTAAEKAQFEDLFINCVLGENKRLPRYVIGGDNSEFFKKVFIFIGRYRAYISTGLLEKLYNFATRY